MRKQGLLALSMILLLWSCGNKPKEIEPKNEISSESIFNEPTESHTHQGQDVSTEVVGTVNKVQVLEFLPTQKYVYMRVENLDTRESYWIASLKMSVSVGDIYFYKEALLKEHFHSQEHDRHFDRIFLVDNIVPADHGNSLQKPVPDPDMATDQITPMEGSVPIATIVNASNEYAGKTVQVTGVCTKVNNNILDRNWIHLKDDSNSNFDFVATTDQAVQVGQQVTLVGTLSTNKDFGAGYQYEIILENCTLVN